MHSRMLAYGAIGLWAAGAIGVVIMTATPSFTPIEGGSMLALAGAIAVTNLWRSSDGGGRHRQTDTLQYKAGYRAGRADERRAHQSEKRIRSVRIDDTDVTIIGGIEDDLNGEVIDFIRAVQGGLS